ncbi:hypothetical protein TNCV_1394301 [Trichonephila clavipes]|nr:hypothetical protein TNCV_1394301 [Trichonephila clavipes]
MFWRQISQSASAPFVHTALDSQISSLAICLGDSFFARQAVPIVAWWALILSIILLSVRVSSWIPGQTINNDPTATCTLLLAPCPEP